MSDLTADADQVIKKQRREEQKVRHRNLVVDMAHSPRSSQDSVSLRPNKKRRGETFAPMDEQVTFIEMSGETS